MSITVEDMKDRLMTVDQLYSRLEATEPLSNIEFEVSDQVQFTLGPESLAGPHLETDVVDAEVRINGTDYSLTKEALLEATSKCGIPKGYAQRTPPRLIQDHLNYWFQEGMVNKSGKAREFKALAVGGGEAVAAFTTGSIVPFSNLALLERAMQGAQSYYGAQPEDIMVDYKLNHSLRHTTFRLIVPEYTRSVQSQRHGDPRSDEWSAGLQVKNSLTGEGGTQLDGYLFAWWCTNGCTNTFATSGKWSRRGAGGENAEDVYDWAAQSVGEIFSDLEGSFDEVQRLTEVPIRGDVVPVMNRLFEQYRIPAALRASIIDEMAETDDLTMYGVLNAITSVANGDDITHQQVTHLLEAAGDIPRTYGNARVAFEAIDEGTLLDLQGEINITLPDGSEVMTRVTKLPSDG